MQFTAFNVEALVEAMFFLHNIYICVYRHLMGLINQLKSPEGSTEATPRPLWRRKSWISIRKLASPVPGVLG